MASSMPTGDRRWAQTRKSGMTVLGKVPKPINLPSQRLENHGLDPNVEIVPKGTLTWGRPSSTGTNAWGTSSLSSPRADGSAGSPSFVSGRPSSGGSGTRPSTAGSDRSHEPVSNAWGPNSRPSSASGILASSQLSTASTRPRSADTRPGSSQLSRFAESSADNTVAWGATGTAERLGTVSSKTSGFTLSSGDFPTLGSEKSSDSHSQRGHSSQGRPTSASGIVSTPKETLEPNLAGNRNIDHSEHGNVNTWKAENHHCVGDAAPPYWHKDPRQALSYPNVNMPPPHQFDSWHNPSLHPADGTWYGSGAPVGPYRPPGPPGSYFDYPHVSARPFPIAQAGPRPEGSSAGYRPNNVEPYHPHMPLEPYMGPGHSNIPLRPGPYRGPVPYEGYYGPPQKGFYNSIEKGPVMPMVHPVVYNQYPTQNPNLDPGRYHARPGGYITATNEEQMKADRAHESQGQLRVLLKQHDGWEDRDVHGEGEQSAMSNAPHLERGNQPGLLKQEGDWRRKNQKPEPVSLSPGEVAPSLDTRDLDSRSSGTVKNSIEDSRKATDDGLIRREERTTLRVRDRQQYPAMKKNTLMEKGEGLNIKARGTDGQNELGVHSLKDRTKSKDVTSLPDQSTSMVNLPTSNEAILVPNKLNALTEEKNREPSSDEKVVHAPSNPVGAGENTHFQAQKRGHNVKGADHHAKSKSSRHDNDEWIQKSPGSEPSVTTGVSGKGGPGASPLECASSLEALENHGVLHAASAGDGPYPASSLDAIDHKAQRAKFKEIAMQRAKQLQQQEEERTREQKAKALAKLEELNRRTLAESSNQKSSHSPPTSNDVQNNNEDSGACAPSKTDMNIVQALADNLACDSKVVTLADDDAIKNTGGSIDASSDVAAQASDSAIQTSNMLQNQSLAPSQETASKTIIHATASDSHDTSSKQKQLGYRRRQGVSQDKSTGEKQITSVSTEPPKNTGEVAISTSTSDTSANNDDNSVHHRKRNNRGARSNKNKLDDVLPSSPSPHTEGSSGKLHTESKKDSPSGLVAEALSVPYESLNETVVTQSFREVSVIPLNQGLSESNVEKHARVSNQWKPLARKFPKNHQANKPVPKYHGGSEAVIWAPVKPPNKIEPSEDVSKNIVTETTYPSGKSAQDTQGVMKTKRAEIERYVPKPVAKELSQQVNSQQSSPSTQAGPCNMSGKPDSLLSTVEHGRANEVSVGKANFDSDSRNGENIKHNHGKSASWRQRSSPGSPSVEGSLSSNSVKSVQKASDQLQPSMADSMPKGQLTHIDDGWNDNNDSLPLVSVVSNVAVKNVGVNRHRRQPYKVQRGPGTTYTTSDNMDVHRGMADKSEYQSPAVGLNDSVGGKIMSTESQNAIGEHARPHWQPKSQVNIHHGRQGNRGGGGGQRVSAQCTENNDVQNEHKNVLNSRSVSVEARAPHYQEGKRERKTVADLSRENTSVDLAAGVNPQHQQSVTFGDTQRAHYGNRFQRGQDSGYKGKDSGQDAVNRNLHVNGDKRKDGSHLAFQQIGNYHKPGEPHQQNPVSGSSHEGSQASGSRYRERGRHHSRGGGHFYGQSSGPARVSAYNSGE